VKTYKKGTIQIFATYLRFEAKRLTQLPIPLSFHVVYVITKRLRDIDDVVFTAFY